MSDREILTPDQNILADALPREMARVRDEVIPIYQSIGPVGSFAIAMMRESLDRAARAAASGDVIAMIAAYQDLKECKV